jgi:acyl carrier protein
MTHDERLNLFRKIATEVVEKDFSGIVSTAQISELGIDSLGMLEIIGEMERQLKIQLPDEALANVVTVQNLLDEVATRQVAT